MCWGLHPVLQGCGRPCWHTELGGQLTWLLPMLILVCLCCRYALSALCRLSFEVFLTLLRGQKAGDYAWRVWLLCVLSRQICPPLPGADTYHVPFPPQHRAAAGRGWLGTAPGPCVELRGARCHPAWKQKPGPERRAAPGSFTSSPAWGRAGWQPDCKICPRSGLNGSGRDHLL